MNPLTVTLRKVFGTQNDRELKSIRPIVARVNELEPGTKALSNDQLRAKTAELKERIGRGESLDSILPEAFATVREAAWRVIGQRHYDVQLVGGATLHRGRIAEMRTGEGKTLVATLPTYLNALEGKGVHVVTVNDYLAKRDAGWMGQIHAFLGLSVGVIVHGLTDAQRKRSYACDITYGQNNEFGFDYLRDNMKFRLEDYVQRDLHYAVVDEVDSILIDEARTPLIISGPTEDSTDMYYTINDKIVAGGGLEKETDYTVDEKSRTAVLTDSGVDKMESRLGIQNLYDPSNIEVLHHVNQGLRAHVLFKRDVDYVVRDGEVLIVDEFTGRLMPGRRWSDGLHQAIEAKEGVSIENENQTLATITFQNYFRMYKKLSGMTGTADTEATEFRQIYKLDVTVIPTNKEMIRVDHSDVIYKSEAGKYKSILEEIRRLSERGQPVLIGTISIEKSEKLSALLKKEGVKHHVLNAKQHEREAEIVAQAGRKGSLTISTNMAGRGTDILLGGNPEFHAKAEVGALKPGATPEEKADWEKRNATALETWRKRCAAERDEVLGLGGLFILGTERHESRRIDNQLRGRAGRQGDPGESRFYLSLDDDLMRIFGGVKIARFMEEDLPIEHRWINRAIENAQKKVEGHNYDIRKHLLEYDDVMNQQRKVVYSWRREVLGRPSLREMVFSMVHELADAIAEDFFPGGKLKRVDGRAFLDVKELNDAVAVTFSVHSAIEEKEIEPFNGTGLAKLLVAKAEEAYRAKEELYGESAIRQIEKMVLLTTIDQLWKDHLLAMDHLREGIGLQGYGQKDPLIEYKKQGYRFFEMMMKQITGDIVRKIFAVQLAEAPPEARDVERPTARIQYNLTPDGDLVPSDGAAPPVGAAASSARGRNGRAAVDPRSGRGSIDPRSGRAPVDPLSGRAATAPPGPGAAVAPGAFDQLMARRQPRQMTMSHGAPGAPSSPNRATASPVVSDVPKAGRNDPCPCGSGKKYKKCHGN